MSISENMAPVVISPDEYTPDKGILIAELYSKGEPLRDICLNYPEYLPGMLYVRRWRVMYPAFDALMQEAGGCRAENMVEDILDIADDVGRQSSHNRNRMAAREKLAGWIAPAVYGSGSQQTNDDTGIPVHEMKDAELLAIAAGNRPALDGECVRLEGDGGYTPPVRGDTGAEYEESGSNKPEGKIMGDSVTTTYINPPGEDADIESDANIVLPPEHAPQKKNSESREGGRLSFVGME